jgi:polysaccharide export outer membrane protein
MAQRNRGAILLLMLALLVPVTPVSAVDQYRIGAGDLLSIDVFDEPELSLAEVRVTASGTIPFPLLEQVEVAGLTAEEVGARLKELLLDGYLKKPRISVSIIKYRYIYVTGEVKNPGAYNYVDGLTVEKAIALAGGFSVRGSEDKITLVRESKPDVVESARKTSTVAPGDIVRVGEAFF